LRRYSQAPETAARFPETATAKNSNSSYDSHITKAAATTAAAQPVTVTAAATRRHHQHTTKPIVK